MEEFISASHDIVFKALFAKNKDILKAFLRDVLNLPLTEQASLQVLNDELIPDVANGKLSRLDIHVIMPNKKFNVEMQARKKGFSADRVLYYWSEMFSDGFESGRHYENLDQTFSVNVLGFNFLECEEYHSAYSILENKRHDQLTDKLSIHIFELPKIPKETDINDDKLMWLRLIKANSEEELNMVRENTQNPMIHKSIDTIKELNADVILREKIRQRDKAIRDHENDMEISRLEGREEGIAIGEARGEARGITIGRAEGESRGQAKTLIENVKMLMNNTQKTLTEVLAMLGVKQEEYDKSLALLNKEM